MDQRDIPGGTKFYFGAPARPLPHEQVAGISTLVARVPGIVEAHLPQCFIEGEPAARQVLVLVVSAKSDIRGVAVTIADGLTGIFPAGQFIDILPFPVLALPEGVRQAECQIYPSESKSPFWKLW